MSQQIAAIKSLFASAHRQRLIAGIAAMTATPLALNAQCFGETHQLIGDLQRLIIATGESPSFQSNARTAERKIREVFSAIDQLAQSGECNEPGRVYIAGENPDFPGQIPETVHVKIIGQFGDAHLTFVSGTSLSAVVAAINTYVGATGVLAAMSLENPQRVELQSLGRDVDQYVTVTQFGDSQPLIRTRAIGGPSLLSWTDYGCAVGVPQCATNGELYLSTTANLGTYGLGSTTLIVRGTMGSQRFTFASGTAQADIITAINTFQTEVGVIATQSETTWARVRVRSFAVGREPYIWVQQVGGVPPIIFESAVRGTGSYDAFDYGANGVSGDANCDRAVDVADLNIVLNGFGACPEPPATCAGDVTGDGEVDTDDILRVINNWGAQQ